MTSSGIPSATSPSPFDLGAIDLINNKNLLLFYGFTPAMKPFQGGTLCVLPPIRRGTPQPLDPTGYGEWVVDVTGKVPGDDEFFQVWYRDPQDLAGSGTRLSDALALTWCP